MKPSFIESLKQEIAKREKEIEAMRTILALNENEVEVPTVPLPVPQSVREQRVQSARKFSSKATITQFLQSQFESGKSLSKEDAVNAVEKALQQNLILKSGKTDREHLEMSVTNSIHRIKENKIIVAREVNGKSVFSKSNIVDTKPIVKGLGLEKPTDAIYRLLKERNGEMLKKEIRDALRPLYEGNKLDTTSKKLSDLVHFSLDTLKNDKGGKKIIQFGEGTEARFKLASQ